MTSERLSLELIELGPPRPSFVHRLWAAWIGWRKAVEQRDALARFDARMLRDIGITEADVWRETQRSTWDR
jgi:uncharacterized protein YjiS (DUF1127 family)